MLLPKEIKKLAKIVKIIFFRTLEINGMQQSKEHLLKRNGRILFSTEIMSHAKKQERMEHNTGKAADGKLSLRKLRCWTL